MKARKQYHAPQVTDFGNVVQITGTVGNTGNADGGTGQTRKTR